jgi:hypothetical protein
VQEYDGIANDDNYLVLHEHNGVALGRFLTLRARADGQHSAHGPTRCLGKNGFVAKLAPIAAPLASLGHFGRQNGPPAGSEGFALRNLSLA